MSSVKSPPKVLPTARLRYCYNHKYCDVGTSYITLAYKHHKIIQLENDKRQDASFLKNNIV